MISQGISHTAYDVMREYMITGAELDGKYQIPMMERYTGHPGEDTVDFKDSFSPKIKNHRKLTVNFYIHDYEFEKIWNNRYTLYENYGDEESFKIWFSNRTEK